MVKYKAGDIIEGTNGGLQAPNKVISHIVEPLYMGGVKDELVVMMPRGIVVDLMARHYKILSKSKRNWKKLIGNYGKK